MLSRSDRKPGEGGFTLMEILLAVTILGLAYLVILQSFSLSMRNIDRIAGAGREVFRGVLELEKNFLVEQIISRDEIEGGEVFVEGEDYQLLLLTSPRNRRLVTLAVTRR